jgi:hypothetical protein
MSRRQASTRHRVLRLCSPSSDGRSSPHRCAASPCRVVAQRRPRPDVCPSYLHDEESDVAKTNSNSDRTTDSSRERSSSTFSDMTKSVRSRPVAAAAVATAAAAAGAYLLSRRSSSPGESKPLMNWGRKDRDQQQGSSPMGRSSRTQGSASDDTMLETASTASGSAGGTSSTGSSSRRASGGSRGSGPTASGTRSAQTSGTSSMSGGRRTQSSDTGSQTSPSTGNTGLDQISKSETKAGSVSY